MFTRVALLVLFVLAVLDGLALNLSAKWLFYRGVGACVLHKSPKNQSQALKSLNFGVVLFVFVLLLLLSLCDWHHHNKPRRIYSAIFQPFTPYYYRYLFKLLL